MQLITAQISLYPLREASLSEPIESFLGVLRSRGLEVRPGPMSTLVAGSSEALFSGLASAFEDASGRGDVVVVATFSNACSTGTPEP